MKENQNTEWKDSWRDEYIKWICGFANSKGGKLYIGINDNGVVSGVSGAKKLLEDIPNKVRDILGILVDVNLKTKKGKEYLEIKTEQYPHPVSYKGQYHYRSGGTKQELKGAALDKFLLQKQGRHWDGVPLPGVTIKDLSKTAFDYFKKRGVKSKRLDSAITRERNELLLENLRLTDGKYLKRAAILLFHPDPEKYITGAYIKIGFFRTDTELLYQDTIHGNLFEQVDKTMGLLLTKYMKAYISYEGIQRVEEYLFPEEALREALLNAVAHKEYSSRNPIQISVYENKIMIWNAGQLPENWTVKTLLRKHSSDPFNPQISNAFFRAGLIEAWGRGTLQIVDECKKHKIPAPVFTYESSGFWLEMNADEKLNVIKNVTNNVTNNVTGKSSEFDEIIIELLTKNNFITGEEISEIIGKTPRTVFRQLEKLKSLGIIERVGTKGGYWKVLRMK